MNYLWFEELINTFTTQKFCSFDYLFLLSLFQALGNWERNKGRAITESLEQTNFSSNIAPKQPTLNNKEQKIRF